LASIGFTGGEIGRSIAPQGTSIAGVDARPPGAAGRDRAVSFRCRSDADRRSRRSDALTSGHRWRTHRGGASKAAGAPVARPAERHTPALGQRSDRSEETDESNACARTQFWFVDACRQKTAVARKFEQLGLPQTFDIPAGEVDSSPLFLASITGKPAYARPNGRTLFCEALLWALGGGAVASPEDGGLDAWHVSVATLLKALPARVSALAQAEGAEQFVDVAGRPLEAVFHEYKTPPDSDLRVELAPPEAKTKARATLKFDDQILVDALAEWPLERRVAAGLYRLDIVSDPPFLRREKILNIKPPSHATSIKVTP
jgi:hypothetical protein